MVRLIDKMVKHPKVITPLHNYMMNNDLEHIQDEEALTPQDWTGNYKTLDRVPRSWICEYLLWRAKKTHCNQVLTVAALKKVEKESPDMVNLLFHYDTQTVGGMQFPKPCKDKRVATLTFHSRAEQVGNRLPKFLARGALGTGGTVDFMKGCFILTFDEGGVATCIEHTASGDKLEVLPSHITISNRYKLIDNHRDHFARVELLPAIFCWADLFPSGAAWKQHMVTKRFEGLADLAEAQREKHEEERQQRGETVHESMVVLEEANRERAAQSLGNAREKLAERMENRKKRRTLKLAPSDAGAAPAPIQNA